MTTEITPLRTPPTIGRVVLYVPNEADFENGVVMIGPSPFCADVCYVNPETGRINLSVRDHDGDSFKKHDVQLIHADDPMPTDGGYAHWMVYQIKQHEKAAAAE